ncbi:hypothetical protein LCGC14_0414790 [marine sediment metagenome]|uniref:Uncharacterized protein n=1 Tax=marine sediment metagenome TaxID=412755 RepID=A0A0F9SYS5_9ZZZZ
MSDMIDMTPNEADVARREANRAVYTFKIPKHLQGETDNPPGRIRIETVGLVELTGGEEMAATKRAQNDLIAGQFELAKEALRQVNNKPVHSWDGSVDQAFNGADPRVRTLIMNAYRRIHEPEKKDMDAFLGSVSVS